jgi:nucleoside 2-deoxyribosyltransferase
MRTVYLAGPILGCTRGEANDWRSYMSERLSDVGIIGVSPLRCEPLIGDRYSMEYQDPRFGVARAIAGKNRMDVKMTDMTLCFFPRGAPFSKGTLVELAWANAYEKPTILVTPDKSITDHPVVQACANWVLSDLDEAFDVISGVLCVYSQRPVYAPPPYVPPAEEYGH